MINNFITAYNRRNDISLMSVSDVDVSGICNIEKLSEPMVYDMDDLTDYRIAEYIGGGKFSSVGRFSTIVPANDPNIVPYHIIFNKPSYKTNVSLSTISKIQKGFRLI